MGYFNTMLDAISKEDPIVSDAIKEELDAQRSRLKLIASENYCSEAVQAAMGSIFTDKYAEGIPGHRYYSGCERVDLVESRAQDLAKQLFGADHAYVQPASGCDANNAAYWAILNAKVVQPMFERIQTFYRWSGLEPPKTWNDLNRDQWNDIRDNTHKQKLLSLSIDCGGHLTHSSPMNTVNQLFDVYTYGVGEDGLIDYREVEQTAMDIRPLILLAGYSAYPGRLDFSEFRRIADRCGAVLMVDMAHFAGLVAGKEFADKYDPIPYADIVTTTTHKTLRGPRGGLILCKEWLSEWVDKTCPVTSGGPMENIIAAKAIAFDEALRSEFKDYAHQIVVNAKCLANRLKERGVRVVSGGTENHIVLIDVSNYGITGRQAESALLECDVVTNRNSLPNDPNGAWYTSGIRLGTPALTTCGMKEDQMVEIADCIADVLENTEPTVNKDGSSSKSKFAIYKDTKNSVQYRIGELLRKFPPYRDLGGLDNE